MDRYGDFNGIFFVCIKNQLSLPYLKEKSKRSNMEAVKLECLRAKIVWAKNEACKASLEVIEKLNDLDKKRIAYNYNSSTGTYCRYYDY